MTPIVLTYVITFLVFSAIYVVAQFLIWMADRRDRKSNKHRHEFERVGYGGCGWSVYECPCGEKEIDA